MRDGLNLSRLPNRVVYVLSSLRVDQMRGKNRVNES